MSWMVFLGLFLIVIAGILILVRRSEVGKLREMRATETVTARELTELAKSVREELQNLGQATDFSRIVEVKGAIRCDSPLTSELGKEPCVYYSASVTREYEETYWETNSQTQQRERRTRNGSDTVSSNTRSTTFWVEDETGRVLVNPEGASVDATQVVDRFESRESAGGSTISFSGFSFTLGDDTGDRRTLGYRFRESILPLDRRVYVLGEATDISGALTMQKPREKGRQFIVSLKSEEELISSTGSSAQWLLYSAAGSGVVGLVLIVLGLLRR